MNPSIYWFILIVAGVAILIAALKYGVVGIRGGSVDRAANPVAFWLAIAVLCVGLVGCLLALLFGR
jgi:hypothetical protein